MIYAPRDTESLGEYYMRHVEAMTAEGLHEKSAIAAELAYRDAVIDSLRKQLDSSRVTPAVPTGEPPLGVYEVECLPGGGEYRKVGLSKAMIDAMEEDPATSFSGMPRMSEWTHRFHKESREWHMYLKNVDEPADDDPEYEPKSFRE